MSWGDGTRVPTSGNSLVIVGNDDNGLLHIRIFDATGHGVTDTDETKVPTTQASWWDYGSSISVKRNSKAIRALKRRLAGWLPPHVLIDIEKAYVIRQATSIVGQTRFYSWDEVSYCRWSPHDPGVLSIHLRAAEHHVLGLGAEDVGQMKVPSGICFYRVPERHRAAVEAAIRASGKWVD